MEGGGGGGWGGGEEKGRRGFIPFRISYFVSYADKWGHSVLLCLQGLIHSILAVIAYWSYQFSGIKWGVWDHTCS